MFILLQPPTEASELLSMKDTEGLMAYYTVTSSQLTNSRMVWGQKPRFLTQPKLFTKK